jgi:hypothetical protein
MPKTSEAAGEVKAEVKPDALAKKKSESLVGS